MSYESYTYTLKVNRARLAEPKYQAYIKGKIDAYAKKVCSEYAWADMDVTYLTDSICTFNTVQEAEVYMIQHAPEDGKTYGVLFYGGYSLDVLRKMEQAKNALMTLQTSGRRGADTVKEREKLMRIVQKCEQQRPVYISMRIAVHT